MNPEVACGKLTYTDSMLLDNDIDLFLLIFPSSYFIILYSFIDTFTFTALSPYGNAYASKPSLFYPYYGR